ncbi:MAG: acyl-CoA dehydrogenase family protein [Chloroflexi bacterium]|nr:acyl-CoA dehydrogenase family protein [Chloroflexota bacterium]
MTSPTTTPALLGAHRLAAEAEALAAAAVARAAELTAQGSKIDDHQVLCERLAYIATEARAVRSLVSYCERLAGAGRADPLSESQALAYAAEVVAKMIALTNIHNTDFADVTPVTDEVRTYIRQGVDDARLREIGAQVIAGLGANNVDLDNDDAAQTRAFARQFAKAEVLKDDGGMPLADRIHREDLLIPESLIKQYAELGFFGSSIPSEYGGNEMGYLTMVVLTEELSAASLIAGSLLTRCEILSRALLVGGTERQKKEWLPKLASGELLVGIAITEPDIGSETAAVQCKATPAEGPEGPGFKVNGAKAWATFAGRADVLALLARTGAEPGHRGLSLLIVPKERSFEHKFEFRQPGGGVITGEAIPTPGYRGMHSYMLNFENYFVPAENLIGEEDGLGRGSTLTLGGMQAGRLQTGGRALGVAQASLEKACQYTTQRVQFGKPISEFQLTQYKIGQIATRIAAARQLTYDVARQMDPTGKAPLLPAMAKLFASDVAVWASQEAQLLHGGWGYAEEDRISRYVADAQVLPIFEGVKVTLELKVIARALCAG